MRKIQLILTGILLFGMPQVKAQIGENLVPHFGFMLERTFIGDNPVWSGTALNIGTYYILFHHNDIVSGGLDANFQGSLRFPRGPGMDFLIQTPVYGMVRFGANATKYNQQAFGVSIGGGINYTTVISTGNNWRVGYFVPEFVGEITLVSRGSPITGRVHFTPLNPQSTATDGNTYQFQGILGLGLLYGF